MVRVDSTVFFQVRIIMITVLKRENFIKDFRNPLSEIDNKTVFESILTNQTGKLAEDNGWYFVEWYIAYDKNNHTVAIFVSCYDADIAWSYVIL